MALPSPIASGSYRVYRHHHQYHNHHYHDLEKKTKNKKDYLVASSTATAMKCMVAPVIENSRGARFQTQQQMPGVAGNARNNNNNNTRTHTHTNKKNTILHGEQTNERTDRGASQRRAPHAPAAERRLNALAHPVDAFYTSTHPLPNNPHPPPTHPPPLDQFQKKLVAGRKQKRFKIIISLVFFI